MATSLEFTTSYMKDVMYTLRFYKATGENAMAQIGDEALFTALDAESNSIATIVKHLSGNMRSRWTDFLTTDGEKPGRNRDSEFEAPPKTRAEVMTLWEGGWKCMFDALEALTDEQLGEKIKIRGEVHSVLQAINRQMTHHVYHVGQIVYLAKHFAGAKWVAITIPRGKSAEYFAKMTSGQTSGRASS